jgi:hypothetical protein
MRIIFLLIALTLVSCGKKEESWKSPSLYLLRTEKNKVLSSSDRLDLNDYIYFSNEDKNPTPEDLKTKSGKFILEAAATCLTNGTTFKQNISVSRNYVQLKEFIPIGSLLTTPTSSCRITIVLQNSAGSTKSYAIPEKIIEVTNFKEDLQLNSKILYSEFGAQKISTKLNDHIDLICDAFTASVNSENDTITLEDILDHHQIQKEDIDVKQYKPSQFCRIALRSIEKTQLSNQFEINFEKLTPIYSYSIFQGPKQKRQGGRLFLYEIKLSNPNSVPVSVAFNKSAITAPVSRIVYWGREQQNALSYAEFKTSEITYSDSKLFIDKGNAIVIYLLPSEAVTIQASVITPCDVRMCYVPRMKIENLPIYNLEYNYRSLDEIQQAVNVKVLDPLIAN